MTAEEILDRLYALLGKAVLLPIPLGKKGTQSAGWQKLTFAESKRKYSELRNVVSRGGNIGVLLGPASERLLALDLDDDDLIAEWLRRHPWLANTLRSKGRRGCQFWLRLEPDCLYPSGKAVFKLTDEGQDLGELRLGGAGGAQSVIFGVHPAGMRYEIVVEKQPLVISLVDLAELVPDLLFEPEQPEKPEAATKGVSAAPANLWDRVTRYLDTCEPAISKRGGHDTTFRVLCRVIGGFDLSPDLAWDAASYYNLKCEPAWNEKELRHKVEDALGATANESQGYLLEAENQRDQAECAGAVSRKPRPNSAEPDFWEEKYVEELESHIGAVQCVGDEWFVCADGVWRPRSRDEFKPFALKVLPSKMRTHRKAKEIFSHLEMRNQVPRSHLHGAMKFGPAGDVLVAVQNGILRIGPACVDLYGPNPEEAFTIALPVRYDPNAVAPTFNRVLNEAVPDVTEREIFLDVLATALVPDCRFEAAIVAIGEAGSGKSTVAGVIPKIFGDACSSLSMADLCHPLGYKLAMLERKAINIGTELNALEVEDSGLFKQLISGERFTARPIYGRPFEMQSSATMLFLTNLLPRFKHGSAAETRRLRFVRFDHQPHKPDATLKPRVEADAVGVFAELVKRARELIAGRPLAEQGQWGKMTAERFAVSNDPVGEFVQRRCMLGPEHRCDKGLLFEKFENFRIEYGLSDKMDSNWFFRTLYDRFPKVRGSKIRQGSGYMRLVTGIDLHEEEK